MPCSQPPDQTHPTHAPSQPLNVVHMFYVRSSPCPAPDLQLSLPLCAAVSRHLLCLLARSTSPRIVCPPFGSRQGASAFNQPLSFNTSSVTTMRSMFNVRSARALYAKSAIEPSPAHRTPRRPRLHGSPQLAPHQMPSFQLWAGRVGVQPAAELRHVQRHRHEKHVQRALRAYSARTLYPKSATEPSPAHRTPRRPRLPALSSPRIICPLFGSARRRSISR